MPQPTAQYRPRHAFALLLLCCWGAMGSARDAYGLKIFRIGGEDLEAAEAEGAGMELRARMGDDANPTASCHRVSTSCS